MSAHDHANQVEAETAAIPLPAFEAEGFENSLVSFNRDAGALVYSVCGRRVLAELAFSPSQQRRTRDANGSHGEEARQADKRSD
jgi:hypothetical protein